MRLFTLQEIDTAKLPQSRFKQSMVFRQSRTFCLIPPILSVGLIVGLVYWYYCGNAPLSVVIVVGGLLGLVGCITFAQAKKTLASPNWILAIEPDQVFIKFRSYLNPHFPPTDPQVVRLHLTKIESARITKQKLTLLGISGKGKTSYHTFLDLTVAEQDISLLQDQIKYERNLKPPLTGKFIKSRSKSHHYPVSVIDNRTIRIEWRSPADWITPKITIAVQLLGDLGIKIDSPKNEIVDMTKSGADPKRMEDNILRMAERGKVIAATALARRTYGLSLTEAKLFVEELVGKE